MEESQEKLKVLKSVRVKRVEIIGSEGDFPAEKKRFATISVQIQQIVNDFATHWLRLHYEAGNHLLVRKWIEKDREWARTPKKDRVGNRVKCPVESYSKAMSKAIYDVLNDDYKMLGTKPIGLAIQKARKRLIQSSATKSAYPRWMMILSGCGEFPQSSRPLPIPFYTSNCKLIIPIEDKDYWRLQVRFEQKEIDERGLVPITLKLKTGGFRLASLRHTLWQIAKGEWKFCASDLIQRDGKWYAHICYQIPKPETVPLDEKKVAFLAAGCHNPILFRIGGFTLKWLRRGSDVKHTRQTLTMIRFGKNESYKYASSAKKGHGCGVAMSWQEKLRRRWRDFVKTWNGRLAAEIAKRCIQGGIGTLVVYQPVDDWRDTRFLTNAGKIPSRVESTGWDWYQMQSLINRACNEVGIKVIVKQIGERKKKKCG